MENSEDTSSEIEAEPTLKELFKAILNNNADIKKSRDEQLTKFEEMKNEVNSKIANTNARIDVIATDVDKITDDVNSLKIKFNELEQDKLANYMDVTGIDDATINKNKSDALKLTHDIFKSFKFVYDHSVVSRAYIREIRSLKKFVLVVIFTSYDEKMKIMKLKREVKVHRNIFFDHSMTPATRKIFVSAKQRAKTIGAKSTFLGHGRVFIYFDENKKIKVNSVDDVAAIQQLTTIASTPMETNSE